MARWRIAVGAAIVVALAVVAAFVVSSVMREEPEVAAEPVVAPASPSPTATADPDPMPELHNTGEDFDRIIRSIEEFRNWLYRNPNPDLVDRIYHEACECNGEMKARLQDLLNAGFRVSQGGALIHEVELLDRVEDAVALKVLDESRPTTVVDAKTGDVVDSDDGHSQRWFRILLVRNQNQWRVKDIRTASEHLSPESDV